MLRAVLLDVGGTLWPDQPTTHLDPNLCLDQVGRLLPKLDASRTLDSLRLLLRDDDGSIVQDST
jgi:hypothetical protein